MVEKRPLAEAMKSLVDLVARLRGPGGCPWDARQDEFSIKNYLLEEAYEVVDAIDRGVPDQVRLELGDLLFQIVFLSDLASERGEFDLADVVDGITEKMTRRHPHVFGSTSVSCAEEVVENWEKIKRAEKDGRGDRTTTLDDVPSGLPALLRAHRLQQRAAGRPAGTPGDNGSWRAVLGAFRRLEDVMETGDQELVEEHAGRLFFAMVALCRRFRLNSEEVLQKANRRFIEDLQPRPAEEDKD